MLGLSLAWTISQLKAQITTPAASGLILFLIQVFFFLSFLNLYFSREDFVSFSIHRISPILSL